MTTTQTQCDPRALRVARNLHREVRPAITILFGSRVRGDYVDGRSDIDIMLVQETLPPGEAQLAIGKEATDWAEVIYGQYTPVRLVWQTIEEFHQMRRTVNHVTVHALREGILMSEDPAYNGRNYDNDEEDYSYEWTLTEERLRHAERHIEAFNGLIDLNLHDSMIGQHAQGAMEHALKALISARARTYPHVHEIDQLVARALRVDRGFRFTPAISGDIYNQYVGVDEYLRTPNPISLIDDFRNKVNTDVQTILDRINEIQQSQEK